MNVAQFPSAAQAAARKHLLETTVPNLRATGRDVTAAEVEGAARRHIPESVAERIALVIDGLTAGAFVSTPPGDPSTWRLWIFDTADRITWWNGEETG